MTTFNFHTSMRQADYEIDNLLSNYTLENTLMDPLPRKPST